MAQLPSLFKRLHRISSDVFFAAARRYLARCDW
jgi:hypothetical protein